MDRAGREHLQARSHGNIGQDHHGKSGCHSGMHQRLVVLLVMRSIFARLFTRKCSSADLNGVGTWESSKGSSSASLDAFLTIWLGFPSLNFRYFRFQDFLLCY